MERLKAILGYFAAGLAILAAILTPFVLLPLFQEAIGAMGIQRDPVYAGGEVVRTLDRGAYRIDIHKPVGRVTPFQEVVPFVQVDWSPAEALPERVQEELDLNGDGAPDLAVSFAVPKDPKAPLSASVKTNGVLLKPVSELKKGSFYELIVQAGDRVILRVPLAQAAPPPKR